MFHRSSSALLLFFAAAVLAAAGLALMSSEEKSLSRLVAAADCFIFRLLRALDLLLPEPEVLWFRCSEDAVALWYPPNSPWLAVAVVAWDSKPVHSSSSLSGFWLLEGGGFEVVSFWKGTTSGLTYYDFVALELLPPLSLFHEFQSPAPPPLPEPFPPPYPESLPLDEERW